MTDDNKQPPPLVSSFNPGPPAKSAATSGRPEDAGGRVYDFHGMSARGAAAKLERIWAAKDMMATAVTTETRYEPFNIFTIPENDEIKGPPLTGLTQPAVVADISTPVKDIAAPIKPVMPPSKEEIDQKFKSAPPPADTPAPPAATTPERPVQPKPAPETTPKQATPPAQQQPAPGASGKNPLEELAIPPSGASTENPPLAGGVEDWMAIANPEKLKPGESVRLPSGTTVTAGYDGTTSVAKADPSTGRISTSVYRRGVVVATAESEIVLGNNGLSRDTTITDSRGTSQVRSVDDGHGNITTFTANPDGSHSVQYPGGLVIKEPAPGSSTPAEIVQLSPDGLSGTVVEFNKDNTVTSATFKPGAFGAPVTDITNPDKTHTQALTVPGPDGRPVTVLRQPDGSNWIIEPNGTQTPIDRYNDVIEGPLTGKQFDFNTGGWRDEPIIHRKPGPPGPTGLPTEVWLYKGSDGRIYSIDVQLDKDGNILNTVDLAASKGIEYVTIDGRSYPVIEHVFDEGRAIDVSDTWNPGVAAVHIVGGILEFAGALTDINAVINQVGGWAGYQPDLPTAEDAWVGLIKQIWTAGGAVTDGYGTAFNSGINVLEGNQSPGSAFTDSLQAALHTVNEESKIVGVDWSLFGEKPAETVLLAILAGRGVKDAPTLAAEMVRKIKERRADPIPTVVVNETVIEYQWFDSGITERRFQGFPELSKNDGLPQFGGFEALDGTPRLSELPRFAKPLWTTELSEGFNPFNGRGLGNLYRDQDIVALQWDNWLKQQAGYESATLRAKAEQGVKDKRNSLARTVTTARLRLDENYGKHHDFFNFSGVKHDWRPASEAPVRPPKEERLYETSMASTYDPLTGKFRDSRGGHRGHDSEPKLFEEVARFQLAERSGLSQEAVVQSLQEAYEQVFVREHEKIEQYANNRVHSTEETRAMIRRTQERLKIAIDRLNEQAAKTHGPDYRPFTAADLTGDLRMVVHLPSAKPNGIPAHYQICTSCQDVMLAFRATFPGMRLDAVNRPGERVYGVEPTS